MYKRLAGCLAFALTAMSAMNVVNADSPSTKTEFFVPSPDSGTLATVRSVGHNRPSEPKFLYLDRTGHSHRVAVDLPNTVRWRTPAELVVRQSRTSVDATSGGRVVRIDRDGRELGVVDATAHVMNVRPSPDANEVAWIRIHPITGKLTLEVYPLQSDGDRDPILGKPITIPNRRFHEIVWSPDSKRIALGISLAASSGRASSRLHMLDLGSQEVTLVPDGLTEDPGPAGVNPLLWNDDGLFAKTQNRILRCDPSGGGCSTVHAFEDFRVIRSATAVGGGRAYVLVTDVRPDVFETRANELFQVDLAKGGAERLLRTPENVFLDDIDWIAD